MRITKHSLTGCTKPAFPAQESRRERWAWDMFGIWNKKELLSPNFQMEKGVFWGVCVLKSVELPSSQMLKQELPQQSDVESYVCSKGKTLNSILNSAEQGLF